MERWLKRIFSLEFLSVVIAIIGTYYGYKQFVRDEPGKITLCTGKFTLEENIRWILIGFDMESESTDLDHMLNIPLFGNMGKQPIEDVFMCGSIMENNISFEPNKLYKFNKGEVVGNENPYVFSVRMEKIPYYGFFPFPLNKIKGNPRNGVHASINMAYTYKGHPELENYFFIITGIPKQYKKNSQQMYAKYVIPYLKQINKPKSVAVIYKDTVVTGLKDSQILNDQNFYNNVTKITDLKK